MRWCGSPKQQCRVQCWRLNWPWAGRLPYARLVLCIWLATFVRSCCPGGIVVNWSDQISRFEPLVVEAVPIFASPTEMEQAVTTYNRALAQLWQDSRDIALIALRTLASSYPVFTQTAFLLGCLLADSGRLKEATRSPVLCSPDKVAQPYRQRTSGPECDADSGENTPREKSAYGRQKGTAHCYARPLVS